MKQIYGRRLFAGIGVPHNRAHAGQLSIGRRGGACWQPVEYGRENQAILASRCYACHGPDESRAGGICGLISATRPSRGDQARRCGGSPLIERITSTPTPKSTCRASARRNR